MVDTRWADEIERSFGSGPTPPPPATYVASGRAAVRRRRIAAGAASTFAAALVIGGIGWSVMPGDARPDAGQVATEPAPTATEKPTPSPGAKRTFGPVTDSPDDVRAARLDEREWLVGSSAVTVIGDGTLIRRRDWTVDRVEVLEGTDRARAWGIAAHADDGSEAEWILLQWDRASSSSTSNPAGQRFATFDEWLAVVAAEQLLPAGSAEPGEGPLDTGGIAKVVGDEVVADDGVTLLEVVMAPEEAAAYGPVDEQAAVRLRLADGRVVFGRVDAWRTTTVDPAVLEEPAMAAFLDYLESQGAGGEGLR